VLVTEKDIKIMKQTIHNFATSIYDMQIPLISNSIFIQWVRDNTIYYDYE
jgi:hypothetical protein